MCIVINVELLKKSLFKARGKYGQRISVTKEVYKAYYRCRDREKYLDKLAEDNNISLEGCYEKGISVEYIISTAEDSMEDMIITGMLLVKLRQCLKTLDEPEKQ
ncbi:hypothetical protein [Lutispora sp.]|uniref:hypothetical protein n=1 Tax=Lutispora sp. TaxID=2828727 RepID=UPI002B1F3572|nr:hypothetical protein [Lutispora sp.]MEA4963475.1 hypothetical protein [Lutispora sp.]